MWFCSQVFLSVHCVKSHKLGNISLRDKKNLNLGLGGIESMGHRQDIKCLIILLDGTIVNVFFFKKIISMPCPKRNN